jgi:putative phosphoesterase
VRRIGVISDTHGLLRPDAIAFLEGCDHIIHAGDIADRAVLDALRAIGPLTIVRGNNDRGPWTQGISSSEMIEVDDVHMYIVHDIADMAIDPVAAGVSVVISGHSHKPSIARRDGVLYLNPGSAGPRRFTLPIAMAELTIDGSAVDARIIELEVRTRAGL